jgi:hypothetical protein
MCDRNGQTVANASSCNTHITLSPPLPCCLSPLHALPPFSLSTAGRNREQSREDTLKALLLTHSSCGRGKWSRRGRGGSRRLLQGNTGKGNMGNGRGKGTREPMSGGSQNSGIYSGVERAAKDSDGEGGMDGEEGECCHWRTLSNSGRGLKGIDDYTGKAPGRRIESREERKR